MPCRRTTESPGKRRSAHAPPRPAPALGLVGLLILGLSGSLVVAGEFEGFPELRGEYFGQAPPGEVAEIFAPGLLKPAEGYHSAIVFDSDGDEACWTGMGSGKTYWSCRVDGVWTRPELLTFDREFGVREPMYACSDQRLYFLSRRPLPHDPMERERLWYVDRTPEGWSQSTAIDEIVAAHPTHWQFSFTADGDLYFTSEAPGVAGGQDIYVARREGESFLDPVSVGEGVNSDFRDFCPFVAPDESYLIFARTGPEGNRRADLYISFRNRQGNWSEAVSLGDRVNTRHNEVCPVVTSDGRYLFFMRGSSEMNDVFWIKSDFIRQLRHQ